MHDNTQLKIHKWNENKNLLQSNSKATSIEQDNSKGHAYLTGRFTTLHRLLLTRDHHLFEVDNFLLGIPSFGWEISNVESFIKSSRSSL